MKNSTLEVVLPLVVAFQVVVPERVAPEAMLEVTVYVVGAGAGAGAAATTAVAALVAEVEPALFVAVTTTRSVEPTSADASV
jgi:uridylate kinase